MKNQTLKSCRGFAAAIYLIGAAVVGLAFAAHKIYQAFEPDTHKAALVQADQTSQAAAAAAKDAQTKALADQAAHQAAEAALQKQIDAINVKMSDIAGMDYTAGLALAGEPKPSDAVQLAQTLLTDAGKYLPQVTAQQQKDAIVIVGLQHDKAALAQALAEKTREADLHAAGEQKAQLQAQDALVKAAQSDDVSKVAQANTVAVTADAAARVARYDAQTNTSLTTLQRVKALFGGFSIILFVVIPLVALAFPGTWPFLKSATKPFLGFIHMIHDRILAAEQSAHAVTKTALAAEQAAHAVTAGVLEKTQAQVTAIATAP